MVQTSDEVAAFVPLILGAGVLPEQVVHQPRAAGQATIGGPSSMCRSSLIQARIGIVEQVAGRVEGERFAAQCAVRSEQPAHWVIAISQRAAPHVADTR
ncbi:hypothetical protein D3C87_1437280 [compost metagenome]